MPQTDSVLDLIESGTLDNELDEIMAWCRDRKQVIARRVFHELQIGDKVQIKSIRPRYLIGAFGIIEDKRVTKLSIRFPDDLQDQGHDPYGKWSGKIGILAPSMVEKVEDGG